MNPGGIRTSIVAGTVTWGELFAVQPFGNDLVRMELTGDQIRQLLEQQWLNQPFPRMLQISGLQYTWDAARPVGSRVVEIRRNGGVLDPAAMYSVTVNSFLRFGGDNFTVLTQGASPVVGPVDLDAFVEHVSSLPQPFVAPPLGRIQRLN